MTTTATALPETATAPAPALRAPRVRRPRRWADAVFVLPYLTMFVGLLVVPLVIGIWLSTTKSDLFGVEAQLGFDNFVRLFRDPNFVGTVVNTLYFVLLVVPALTLIGLGIALVLNNPARWAAVLRTIFFASTVLSVTVVTLIWRLVYIPDGGLLAVIAEAFGREPIAFLGEPDWAMPAIAVTTIWWSIGLPMVLFLAALQQVPRELYEAAALDQATRWKTLVHITLPAIRRTFILVVIIQVIAQFQVFGQPQLMTGGGPNDSTRTLVLFIYQTGWGSWELGYAAAAAQVLFAMILVAAMAQYFVATRKDDQ